MNATLNRTNAKKLWRDAKAAGDTLQAQIDPLLPKLAGRRLTADEAIRLDLLREERDAWTRTQDAAFLAYIDSCS